MCIDVGLQWIRVSLRGHGSEAPTGTEFFETLGLENNSPLKMTASTSAWQAALIELFAVDMSELESFDEPSEEFASRVDRGFSAVSDWLDSRPRNAFERWQVLGRTADVFIGGWLLNEQFDLAIPPQFLLTCGQAGLPIQICTND